MTLDTSLLPQPVAQLAVQAAGFVEARLGESLPRTRIVVGTRVGLARLATRTAVQVVGARVGWWRRTRLALSYWQGARTGLAVTLLAPGGVLVIVNHRALTDPYLPDYLVHELVHAAQFARPGRREQLLAGLADALGTAELAETDLYAGHLRHQVDEGEAYQVEAEHAGVVGAETVWRAAS